MKNNQQNTIEQIKQWFEDAIPNPTSDNLCVQIGCHFEEVCEMLESLGLSNTTVYSELNMVSQSFKDKLDDCVSISNRLLENSDRCIDFVDAMVDQIVTAIGVLYMLGVNPTKALQEVARSNDTKRNPETGKFDRDANGKIIKGSAYEKPNLKPFVNIRAIENT